LAALKRCNSRRCGLRAALPIGAFFFNRGQTLSASFCFVFQAAILTAGLISTGAGFGQFKRELFLLSGDIFAASQFVIAF